VAHAGHTKSPRRPMGC